MTRWKKDETEFHMSLSKSKNRDGSESVICRIPRPIIEYLDNPKSILFKLGKNRVSIEAGSKTVE